MDELEILRQRRMREMIYAKSGKVIVYSTTTCPYCDVAKRYLKDKGVEYEDIDVGRDHAKAQEMVQKSGQMGVPVLDINGTIVLGFNQAAIDAALAGKV